MPLPLQAEIIVNLQKNDGCEGDVDGDGRDPPCHRLYVPHMVTPSLKRNKNTTNDGIKDPEELVEAITNMDVDGANKTLVEVVMQRDERKFIDKDMSCDGPTIF